MKWSVGGKYAGVGETLPIQYDTLVNDMNLAAGIHEVELYADLVDSNVTSYDYSTIEILPELSDFEPDGDVDFYDFAVLGPAWLSSLGDDNWNPVCDISEPLDNVIDALDLAIFSRDWLNTYPIEPALWFECWDNPRQCHGDADGYFSGKDKDGKRKWVTLADLDVLTAVWNAGWPSKYGDLNYNPCADFDRDGDVDGGDCVILETWYEVLDVPADCPQE